ncbi:MAG: WYL domain-containing protein [Paracoccus sp. (in: a-proteobacteria)]|uniref:WYL domain-containing protein n=1 Tax=Paracoccus sp. TaxID=267 RepID=UPI0026E035A0|nr:WYL domain-containing protein [Paracoccus sp. (in: a-proteobacteria)]MDO5621016.1 WYL domain-containing protein [Paracoccus sp. (in: a-proteobacteria)]
MTTASRLTRRALGGVFASAATALGLGGSLPVALAAPVPDPVLRDAMLRGLALAWVRGDAAQVAAAQAAVDDLAQTDPEGALLCRLYRVLDIRPAAYWHGQDAGQAAPEDMALLHRAMAACQPVGFTYTDMQGDVTGRRVLPLALVHPAQGVKLLAWCLERQDYRQFFVREMAGLTSLPGDFRADRLALLDGLVAKEGA